MESTEKSKRNVARVLKWTIGSVAAFIVLAVVALQVMLNSSTLEKLAYKFIPRFVDADVRIDGISASAIRSFPNLNVEVSGVTITYPHSRYAEYDSVGVDGILRHAGRGADVDTLASFNKLRLSVSYLSALLGRIHIQEASIDRPRLYAHSYSPEKANWNILKNISVEETEDTSVTVLPPIAVNRISITGRPSFVFTDCADTIYACAAFSNLHFQGRLGTRKSGRNKLGLNIDSVFVSGRLPADTLLLALDHFQIAEKDKNMHFNAEARVAAGMSQYGRIVVPVALKGDLNFPEEDVPALSLKNFQLDVATLTMTGLTDAKFYRDSTYLRAEAVVDDCSVNDMIHFFGKNFLPEANDLETDAVISFTTICDGYYNPATGRLPELIAEFVVPDSYIRYPDVPDGRIRTDINASTDENGRLNVVLDDMCFRLSGVDIDATGSVSDLIGEDPDFSVKAKATAVLDSLSAFIPDSLGIKVKGALDATLGGSLKKSQMTRDGFYKANIGGMVKSDEIVVIADSVSAWIGSPYVGISTLKNKLDTGIPKGDRVLALTGGVDSLYAVMGENSLRASKFGFAMQNASKSYTEAYGNERNPILGQIDFSRIFMSGADSVFIGLVKGNGSFKYSYRVNGDVLTPIMALNAKIARSFAKYGDNRAGFIDADLTASAVMTTFERDQRRTRILDSLQRVYPGISRDSLFKKAYSGRFKPAVANAETNSDFKDSDLNLDFGKSLSKYLREWDLKGGFNIKDGMFYTPYFPLRNRISDFRFTADNRKLALENLTFYPGASDLTASGEITGLMPALAGRAPLRMDLRLTSEHIDANELLTAFSAGSAYVPENAPVVNAKDVDEQYFMDVNVPELVLPDSTYALIVVPSNIIANISMEANSIKYSSLDIDWMSSEMAMRDRCLQITNTVATSNMGDIYFEGFYSTRSKKDINAGFDLNMADITADKVIELLPAVDTVMPMLKSFKGQLDCEIAATTALDTNMNILMPTMNGVLKIAGRNVSLDDSPEFRKIAKILMFKDKKYGKVGDMSVSGIIADNKLEIFPFVFDIDRYKLAMSGLQKFDQDFKYHISVIKSPLPFRFGVNLFGNFDDWKFRIGKAKYKNANVPVFTAEINDAQANLISSIHNIFARGVNNAVRSTIEMKNAVEKRKSELGYDAEGGLDSLDTQEAKMLDSLRMRETADTLSAVAVGDTELSGLEQRVQAASLSEQSNSADDKQQPAVRKKESRREERIARREEKRAARKARKNMEIIENE